MRASSFRLLPLLVLLLLPFLLPIPEALERLTWLRALGNQLHVVLIAGLTWLLHRRGPLAGRLGGAALAAALAGGAVELLQQLGGRHARLRDFGLDLIGVTLAVSWILWRRRGSRPARVLCLLCLLSVPAQLWYLPGRLLAERAAARRFPVLADLETRDQRPLWGPNDEGRFGVRRPADGGEGRVLQLIAPAGTAYPGVDLRGFPADWSAHAALEGRVRLVEGPGDSAAFVVRLDDWHGHRSGVWASRRLHAGRAWRTFRLPLADLGPHPDGRPPDLADVFSLVIYVPHPARRTVLELDDLRLR